jgi:hypothetical protein
MKITHPLVVYVPDTRGVVVSRYGLGNMKLGPTVFTYSRLPGNPLRPALGSKSYDNMVGTCPGSTPECESVCYAKRPVQEDGIVSRMWLENETEDVPPIPEECRLLRLHVSGDFTSEEYIGNWILRLAERPDVHAWVYTRSWRVPRLLPALERLRALPNMQMFASMDRSTRETPPKGWRVSWLEGDGREGLDVPSYVCPEQTGEKKNCEACRYCFDGMKHDVTFMVH